jgi:hypothetical protein
VSLCSCLFSRRCRPAPRRSALAVERLETRELLSTAIGMNLENVRDYMSAWMFTDGFKESRPWMPLVYNATTHTLTQDPGHIIPLSLDARGWPTRLGQSINAQGQSLQQILQTVMFDGLSGHYPAGTYTAWWQGTGTLMWGGDAVVTRSGTMANGTHFSILNVTPGNQGIRMQMNADSPADPVHDIHVWLPDYNGQSFVGQVWHPGAAFSPFHPLFIERLQPFGTIRGMQTQETITSQIVHWSDRRSVDYATQATAAYSFQNGIAPEYLIELANEVHADLWINVPHMADDDYISHLATLIRTTLGPRHRVYVEWSNEVWNRAPGFIPYQWITQQLALPQNAGVTFSQFVGRAMGHTFDLFTQTFAGQAGRLVRVATGFEGSPAYTASVLQNLHGHFDAVSVAAYFGPSGPQLAGYGASTTETQVMNDVIASIAPTLGLLQSAANLARQYTAALGRPIGFVAYEGGVSLIGRNQPYQNAFLAAGADPRMFDEMRQFLQGANALGMNLFADYVYTSNPRINAPYGDFAALQYQDQPIASAPKYRALLDAAHGLFYPLALTAAGPGVVRAGTITLPRRTDGYDVARPADSADS